MSLRGSGTAQEWVLLNDARVSPFASSFAELMWKIGDQGLAPVILFYATETVRADGPNGRPMLTCRQETDQTRAHRHCHRMAEDKEETSKPDQMATSYRDRYTETNPHTTGGGSLEKRGRR